MVLTITKRTELGLEFTLPNAAQAHHSELLQSISALHLVSRVVFFFPVNADSLLLVSFALFARSGWRWEKKKTLALS